MGSSCSRNDNGKPLSLDDIEAIFPLTSSLPIREPRVYVPFWTGLADIFAVQKMLETQVPAHPMPDGYELPGETIVPGRVPLKLFELIASSPRSYRSVFGKEGLVTSESHGHRVTSFVPHPATAALLDQRRRTSDVGDIRGSTTGLSSLNSRLLIGDRNIAIIDDEDNDEEYKNNHHDDDHVGVAVATTPGDKKSGANRDASTDATSGNTAAVVHLPGKTITHPSQKSPTGGPGWRERLGAQPVKPSSGTAGAIHTPNQQAHTNDLVVETLISELSDSEFVE